MVRISDILKVTPLTGDSQPIREAEPKEAPAPKRARKSRRGPAGTDAGVAVLAPAAPPVPEKASQALYATLVAECDRCLEEAKQLQRVSLGKLPELSSQLVDGLTRHDHGLVHLSLLSLSQDRTFSLAKHAVNVAILAIRVGMELNLKVPELLDLSLGALLHDIGMVKVNHLAQLPDRFNPSQRAELFQHPLWGQHLSRRSPELSPLTTEIIVQEHERVDGTGYPNRLAGNTIHKYAQLVGLLDVYEALAHDRPHRKGMVPAEAMRMVIQGHRHAFQPELLRALLQVIPVYPVGSWVKLNTGETARVIANQRNPLAPSVTIVTDRDGRPAPNPETIDLTQEPQRQVSQAVSDPAL